jgi:hypothetical protein
MVLGKNTQFKVKPGDVFRRPRFIPPYHYRLDWQFRSASTIRNVDRSPWIYPFLQRLLEQDPDVLGLLDSDPFKGGGAEGLKFIRVETYCYKFHKPDGESDGKQPYWTREMIGRVFPHQGVMTLETLKDYTDVYQLGIPSLKLVLGLLTSIIHNLFSIRLNWKLDREECQSTTHTNVHSILLINGLLCGLHILKGNLVFQDWEGVIFLTFEFSHSPDGLKGHLAGSYTQPCSPEIQRIKLWYS